MFLVGLQAVLSIGMTSWSSGGTRVFVRFYFVRAYFSFSHGWTDDREVTVWGLAFGVRRSRPRMSGSSSLPVDDLRSCTKWYSMYRTVQKDRPALH